MGKGKRATTRAAAIGRVLAGLVLCAYPVLVWQGLASQRPRVVALVLLCVLLPGAVLRLRSRAGRIPGLAALPLVGVLGLGLASVLDSLGLMLLVPVAINALLLVAFGATLRPGVLPMIERFARLKEPELTDEERAWCRAWTWIWCGFFVVNGSVALTLALLAPVSWWAFYNGLLSYVLIGLLVAGEWLLRQRRFPASSLEGRGQVGESSR